MKKNYHVLVIILLSFFSSDASFAQIVGGNGYLQGHWLEIGEQATGAFGTQVVPPAGYHPHGSVGIGEVYDYGHDGWTVGAPTYMGDYTLPGCPFEGWEVQMAGGRAQMYESGCTGTAFAGGATMTGGGLTTYSNTGAVIKVNWAGTFNCAGNSLLMNMETRVDTEASWVVCTVKMYNMSGAPIPAVYYMRTCDPDNDESWPGGSFTTSNIVDYQNDVNHRVLVEATGQTGTYTRWGLGTKDCRAVALIYNSWPMTVGQDLSAVWGMTYGGFYNVGVNHPGDIGIALVYNIGTIGIGDSAFVSYAYIFGANTTTTLIDSAFPDPALNVNGAIAYQIPPAPGPIIDTYNACANPGLTAVPVEILYGDDKCWTWGKWTWSPATGLASTTGVTNTIFTTVLPPVITYTITGTDSASCNYRTIYLTLITCNNVRANSPCEGDSLLLRRVGDSTGCTYYWYGPAGFTSTMQDPFRFPAVMADAGEYYVVRTLLGVHDTDSIAVVIHPKPVISASNNAPLCQGMVDTLDLFATPAIPGEIWSWTGPASFTSTVQNPTRPGYIAIDTGIYRVIVTTIFGCKDTAYTDAGIIPQPLPPVVSGPQRYCQGEPFVPWSVTSLVPGGRILWYPNNTVPIGDTLTTTPSVNTLVPGIYVFYFSQRSGSCESVRDSFKVRVYTTPAAPTATGPLQYCQFIGPVIPLTVSPATADTISWYFVSTGGTPYYTEPIPPITVAGTYNYWISQTDSGCESARTPVTITIHPKPHPPIITPTPNCQFLDPIPLIATPDATGLAPGELVAPTPLLWYGPGVTVGTAVTPYPATNIAPDTVKYWVTETTIYGCVSDSALDVNVIKVKPPKPVTKDIDYCQYGAAALLNTLVDSIGNSHLNWYYNATALNPTPRPFTDTVPGTFTWYVSQTVPNDVTGCESDSAALNVTIIYKPVFDINVSAPYVCQFDSLTLSYNPLGQPLFAPAYTWTLPPGAILVNRTTIFDSLIMVQFDTANQNNYVYLHVSDDSGFCASDTVVRIKVIRQPNMSAFSAPDVCLDDTIQLALADRSSGAYIFTWYIDNVLMANSPEINIISSNSNTGGPFEIRWVDSGKHVIMVTSVSQEGCKSYPAYDSVYVHPHPDASFTIYGKDSTQQFCLEDSVYFVANARNYNYSYAWTPAHFFQNLNSPTIWGHMESTESIVVLTVTDPYGCYATTSATLEPQTCCSVAFPNAFTPGGTINRTFEPIMSGFHRFHEFRIVNRWGTTVFDGGNTTVKWDGNYNGVPQDMGTYFYYLKYDCGGKTIEAKGDVTLIR